MKLFIVAALISVASAARLEHLERGYLPPSGGSQYASSPGSNGLGNGGAHGNFGFGGSGQGGSHGSNGFGSSGSNGFGSHGLNDFGSNGNGGSNGFGARGSNGLGSHGSNGLGSQGSNGLGSHGSNGFGNGFGSSASGRIGGSNAASTQYLPPNHGPSGSNGVGGSSIKPACSTCGSAFGVSSQRYSSGQQPQNQFGPQAYSAPSTQYGTPQFGSSGSFGSRPQSFGAQQDEPAGASRQYLAPKSSSNFQNIPQQPFDEQTGYHY